MHRKHLPTVSWLELLQDLAMVVLAITLFSGLQYGWGTTWVIWYGIGVLVAYGSWVAWVFVNNRFPGQGLFTQITSIVWIFGALLAAGGSLWENWLSATTLNFGLAISFGALSVRHAGIAVTHPGARTPSVVAASFSGVAALVLVLGAAGLLPESITMGLGPLLALAGLLLVYPRLLPKTVTVNVDHLSERFGQFVLILIGDGLLEIVLNTERGGMTTVFAIAEVVAVSFLLWRAYFIYVFPAGPPPRRQKLQWWVTFHFILVVGLGLTSTTIAAEAVPLDAELLAHMEAFTRAVGAGITLAMVYLGVGLTLLVAARPSRRVAAPFFVLAGVLAIGHFFIQGALDLVTGLLVIAGMVIVDFLARVVKQRDPLSTSSTEAAHPGA